MWTSLITEKFYSNKNLHERRAQNNCCTYIEFINKAVRRGANNKEENKQYYCKKLQKLCLLVTSIAYFHGFCEVPKNEIAEKMVAKGYLCFLYRKRKLEHLCHAHFMEKLFFPHCQASAKQALKAFRVTDHMMTQLMQRMELDMEHHTFEDIDWRKLNELLV